MGEGDKNRVIVMAVVDGGLSVSDAARRFGVSRRWVQVLVSRYRAEGQGGLTPRSRRPHTSPGATEAATAARVLGLRDELDAAGLDAGAESIRDRLAAQGLRVPSTSTIYRILRAGDRVTHQPHKRPRSSWTRFQAPAPNSCWQSDMTHWHLTHTTGVEIISWLDDHSRYLLHISCHHVVTAPVVTDTFLATARRHGLPASTLTDNGLIYTTRFAAGAGGPNHFEHVIASLGVAQKNGHPGHPQTQGKIERFHQTLKKWLTARPAAPTLAELQSLLEEFADLYNHHRPHRALGRRTPAQAYTALPKDEPHIDLGDRHWRVRNDIVSTNGTVTLRWAGALRHLAIGRHHHGTDAVILIAGPDTIVINRTTGEIIAEHHLDPHHNYQPKKPPGPLPKERP